MHTFLYARVSKLDPTISHQRAQAEFAGFTFAEVLNDEGVSGVSHPLPRPQGRRQAAGQAPPGDILVVR